MKIVYSEDYLPKVGEMWFFSWIGSTALGEIISIHPHNGKIVMARRNLYNSDLHEEYVTIAEAQLIARKDTPTPKKRKKYFGLF